MTTDARPSIPIVLISTQVSTSTSTLRMTFQIPADPEFPIDVNKNGNRFASFIA